MNFNIALCNSYNVSVPDFLGCSPQSTSFSFQSSLTLAPSSSETSTNVSLKVSTITGIEPPVTTESGGPVASFTGGPLLKGTCTNPQLAAYTANNGQVLEYPWVGCSGNAPGCCPFNIMEVGLLSVCPSDYFTTSSACCPSWVYFSQPLHLLPFTNALKSMLTSFLRGWSVYTSTLGGQTPCYTNPPSISFLALAPTITTNGPLASAIATQLFTLRYVLALPKRGLSPGVIAGIAVGAVAAFALFLTLLSLIVRARRRDMAQKSSNRQIPLDTLSPGSAADDQKAFTLAGGTHVNTYPRGVSELPSPISPRSPLSPRSPRSPKGPGKSPRLHSGIGLGLLSPLSGGFPEATSPSENASPVDGRAELESQPTELPGSTFLHEHHPAYEEHEHGSEQGQQIQRRRQQQQHSEKRDGWVQPEEAYSW